MENSELGKSGFQFKGGNRQRTKKGYPVNEVGSIIWGKRRISLSKSRMDCGLGPSRWRYTQNADWV